MDFTVCLFVCFLINCHGLYNDNHLYDITLSNKRVASGRSEINKVFVIVAVVCNRVFIRLFSSLHVTTVNETTRYDAVSVVHHCKLQAQ